MKFIAVTHKCSSQLSSDGGKTRAVKIIHAGTTLAIGTGSRKVKSEASFLRPRLSEHPASKPASEYSTTQLLHILLLQTPPGLLSAAWVAKDARLLRETLQEGGLGPCSSFSLHLALGALRVL